MLGSYQQSLHEEHKKRRLKFYPTTRPPQASKPEKVHAVPIEIFPAAYRVTCIQPLGRMSITLITRIISNVCGVFTSDELKPTRRIYISDVLAAVCKTLNISSVDLTGQQRAAKYVYPRQIAMYLCATLTGRSYPEIGRRIGDRDHTTVLHGKQKIERLIDSDAKLRADIQLVKFQMGAA